MSLDSTAELLFRVNADPADAVGNMQRFRGLLSKDLAGLGAEFDDWARKVFGDLDSVGSALKTVAAVGAASAIAAGAAIWGAAEKTAAFANEIEDGMDKTGLAAEEMSRLRFAAERTGMQYSTLVQSLVLFEAATVKAGQGSAQQAEAFERLGIKSEELQAGQAQVLPLLMRVSDAFKGQASAVEKAAIARDLFGRGGAELLEFLSLGSETIRRFGDDAERLGRVLSEDDVLAAKAFQLANQELKAEMDGLWFSIGTAGLPILQKLSTLLIAVAETMKKDTGGVMGEIRAWSGFFGEWAKAEESLSKALAAATAAAGSGRLGPPAPAPGGGRKGSEKPAAETARDYTELQRILGSVQAEIASLSGDEENLAFQTARLGTEVETAKDRLLEMYNAGKLTEASYWKEMAALNELTRLLPEVAELRRQALEAQQAAEAAKLDERRREEEQKRAEAYERELVDLQEHLAQIVQARLTTSEQVTFLYDREMQKYSEAEEAKTMARARGEEEQLILSQQFALNRAALTAQYQTDLQVLANSEGWQAVFGAAFQDLLRNDEEALRRWAEAADQAMVMVGLSAVALEEIGKRAFQEFARGMAANVAYAIVYSKSVGEAMRMALAATLQSIAAEAMIQAIYATAIGFLRLAQHDYVAAGQAFTAAAVFGSVGVAAAVAGKAVAPQQGGAKGHARASEDSGASMTEAALPAASGGRRGLTQIYIQGPVYGTSGVEELAEILSAAVEDRDVRLVSSDTRTKAQITMG